MTPITIIEFLFFQEWKTLTEATQSHKVLKADNFDDLIGILSDQLSCLILVSIKTKSDLIHLTNLVKYFKVNQIECPTKIAVINVSGNKQIDNTILKLGIQDIVDLSLNAKALKFKVDFWLKSLDVQFKKSQLERIGKGLKPKDTSSKKINNDVWLVHEESDVFGGQDSIESRTMRLENLKGRGTTDHISSKNLSGTLSELKKEPGKKALHVPVMFHDDEELIVITEDAKMVSFVECGNVKFNCRLEDYFEPEMVFILPQNDLKVGTLVNVSLSFDYRQRKVGINFTSAIIHHASDDQNHSYVTVKLDKQSIEATKPLMKLIQARQEGINTFLQRVKGS